MTESAPDKPETHPAGWAAARWPGLVLERLFRHLMIGDLLSCSQVNRLWHQTARCPRLQCHCLVQTWPDWHRQTMEQALTGEAMRPLLESWCQWARHQAGRAGDLLGSHVPLSQELLLACVRRLLLRSHFAPPPVTTRTLRGGKLEALASSPDGQWMAAAFSLPDTGQSLLTLLRYRSGQFTEGPSHSRDGILCHLKFSTNGRSLQALFRTGRLEVWRLPANGYEAHWQAVTTDPPFPGAVHKVVLSPDGQHIAALLRNAVVVYGERGPGGWERHIQWSQTWPEVPERFCLSDPQQLAMKFSDDSRHFVFATGREALVCWRYRQLWQDQSLSLDAPVRGQPLFDSGSRRLVLASGVGSDRGLSMAVRLRCWHFQGGQSGWAPMTDNAPLSARVHPHIGWKVPMTWSPDNQLLAVPAANNCQDARLLSVSDKEGGSLFQVLQELKCQPDDGGAEHYDCVYDLHFGATSGYLAVITGQAVHLWQAGPAQQWRRVQRVSNPEPHARVHCVFSPDGYHCALAVKPWTAISVWGPSGSACYAQKLCAPVCQGGTVECLEFLPDATRLQVVSSHVQILQQDDQDLQDFAVVHAIEWLQLVGPASSPCLAAPLSQAQDSVSALAAAEGLAAFDSR